MVERVEPKKKIVVIDDEPSVQEVVRGYLEKDGYLVYVAGNGRDGLALAERAKPGLVVLDLMLPDVSGEEICREIRSRSDVPILMLTAKAGEDERVAGLALGADDYLTKPFSPRELVARVKALLRRSEMRAAAQPGEVYEKGSLKINFSTYEVSVRGRPAKLTLKEFELLRFLVQNPNRVLNRDQLLDRVWGGEVFVDPRTVDVHIRRLRKAIERNDRRPEWVLTVRGVGYKFDEKALEK